MSVRGFRIAAASMHHVEVLRQPDVARVQHDEAVARARARARSRCPCDDGTIAEVSAQLWMMVIFGRVGALAVDQSRAHGVAETDDASRPSHQEAIDPFEHVVDELALEVFEQAGDLREDILAIKHHAAPRARRQRRQPDDRRIGQRHRDILPRQAQRDPQRREEIGEVVGGAAGIRGAARIRCRARARCGRRCGFATAATRPAAAGGYPATTVTCMPCVDTRSSASSVSSWPVAPVSGQYDRLK